MQNKEQTIKIGVNQKAFPQYLFKYRDANDDYTRKIISDNELYFSNPLLFNDPYDCNPPIDIENNLELIKRRLKSIRPALQNINELALLCQIKYFLFFRDETLINTEN